MLRGADTGCVLADYGARFASEDLNPGWGTRAGVSTTGASQLVKLFCPGTAVFMSQGHKVARAMRTNEAAAYVTVHIGLTGPEVNFCYVLLDHRDLLWHFVNRHACCFYWEAVSLEANGFQIAEPLAAGFTGLTGCCWCQPYLSPEWQRDGGWCGFDAVAP